MCIVCVYVSLGTRAQMDIEVRGRRPWGWSTCVLNCPAISLDHIFTFLSQGLK